VLWRELRAFAFSAKFPELKFSANFKLSVIAKLLNNLIADAHFQRAKWVKTRKKIRLYDGELIRRAAPRSRQDAVDRPCLWEMTSTADLDEQIERLKKCEYLKEAEVKALCERAQEILSEESNVQRVDSPVTVRLVWSLCV
jgi:hypothetical protein